MTTEITALKTLRDALTVAIEAMEREYAVTAAGPDKPSAPQQMQSGAMAPPGTDDNVVRHPAGPAGPAGPVGPASQPGPAGPVIQPKGTPAGPVIQPKGTPAGPAGPAPAPREDETPAPSITDLQAYLARVARGIGGPKVLNVIRKYAPDGVLASLDDKGRRSVYTEVQQLAGEG